MTELSPHPLPALGCAQAVLRGRSIGIEGAHRGARGAAPIRSAPPQCGAPWVPVATTSVHSAFRWLIC